MGNGAPVGKGAAEVTKPDDVQGFFLCFLVCGFGTLEASAAAALVGPAVTVTVTSGAVTVTVTGAAQPLPEPFPEPLPEPLPEPAPEPPRLPLPAAAVLAGANTVTKLVENEVEVIVVVGSPPAPPALPPFPPFPPAAALEVA